MTNAEKMREAAAQAFDRWENMDSVVPDDINAMALAEYYLRKTADFNLSWADGRRGNGRYDSHIYIQRRRDWAALFERMANACSAAIPVDASAPIEWGIGPSVFQPKQIDASAPAADCQQAGLVTVDAAKYGRRNVQKMIRQWDAHRTACRAEGTQAIQDTLDAMEEHIDYAYRADTVPPGLLDEVKAADRISDVDVAMLQSMATSFRARMGFSFNPDDMADLLTRVSAALARLEREVG